jgi:hypothetical protein
MRKKLKPDDEDGEISHEHTHSESDEQADVKE